MNADRENIFNIRSLNDVDLKNKRVFIRTDYNVPIHDGKVTDSYKINSSLSTIREVIKMNPRSIIIGSHLGRPNGRYQAEFSCKPVYDILKEILEKECDIELSFCQIENFKENKFVFVENLRFYPEEQAKNDVQDTTLSAFFDHYVDIVVIDAFGVLHRKDFSVTNTGVPSYAGNLVQKELKVGLNLLSIGVDLIILGGSKIKDKISILETLIQKCKSVYIVGALACSFLKYHFRIETGNSKVEEDAANLIERIYEMSMEHNVKIYVSHDFKIQHFEKLYFSSDIPKEGKVLDIGPNTLRQLSEVINQSNVIFWNGSPGVFEIDECNAGTKHLVEILSKHNGKVVVGGGETSACVHKFSHENDFYHVSTGGGSFLKLLGGDNMPGLDILKK